jgi:RNA polymerase sigma factor (sigma-70 family)
MADATRARPGKTGRRVSTAQDALAGRAGEAIADAALRGRRADADLAGALGRPVPAGPATSAAYLHAMGRRPVLPRALERDLIAGAQAGDRRARAQLVEAFLPMIASVARLYRDAPGVQRIELMQEGVVGLLRALERYADERGPFWPYATWWVRQAMQQLVAELTRPIVLSDRALRQLARVREAHRCLVRETGREPTRAQLEQRTGLSHDQLDDLLVVDRAPRSLDEPIGWDGEAVGTLGELLVDPLSESAYEDVLDDIEARELLALLAGLSDRERTVLRARFGLEHGEEESLRDIGDRLGISGERVRQIERRALGKLAAAAGGDHTASDRG